MYILGFIRYLTNKLGWDSADHGPSNTGIGGRRAPIHQVLAALRLWQKRRTAIRELYALPDKALRDIGLVRGDIPATVTALLREEQLRDASEQSSIGSQTGPFEAASCC